MTQSIEIATGGGALRTRRATYDDRHAIEDHEHRWGQLVYAASGAVHVATATQVWLIPPPAPYGCRRTPLTACA